MLNSNEINKEKNKFDESWFVSLLVSFWAELWLLPQPITHTKRKEQINNWLNKKDKLIERSEINLLLWNEINQTFSRNGNEVRLVWWMEWKVS